VIETNQTPTRYRVSISDRTSDRIIELARKAKLRGDGADFAASLLDFYDRLKVYPQFGDPIIDLLSEVGQVRVGIVRPIAMRYAVLEERKLVFVASLPVLFPLIAPSTDVIE
jgi:hypothetical protein